MSDDLVQLPVFKKSYKRAFINDVLRAVKKYSMFTNGDHVCVGLSGGKDSITLLYILNIINNFSHLHFTLSAAHVKTNDYDTSVLKMYCDILQLPYFETILHHKESDKEKVCSICARLKRGALSSILKENGINILAFGHHADDIAETLLMNIFNNRKLGSFSPIVKVSESSMKIIRPMVYLDSKTISNIHRRFSLPLLKFNCPYATANCRTQFREYLSQTKESFHIPDLSKRFVAAIENYDMTNNWRSLTKEH